MVLITFDLPEGLVAELMSLRVLPREMPVNQTSEVYNENHNTSSTHETISGPETTVNSPTFESPDYADDSECETEQENNRLLILATSGENIGEMDLNANDEGTAASNIEDDHSDLPELLPKKAPNEIITFLRLMKNEDKLNVMIVEQYNKFIVKTGVFMKNNRLWQLYASASPTGNTTQLGIKFYEDLVNVGNQLLLHSDNLIADKGHKHYLPVHKDKRRYYIIQGIQDMLCMLRGELLAFRAELASSINKRGTDPYTTWSICDAVSRLVADLKEADRFSPFDFVKASLE